MIDLFKYWERVRIRFLTGKINVVGGVWNREDDVYEVLVSKKLSEQQMFFDIHDDKNRFTEYDVVPEKVFVRPWKRVRTKVVEVGVVKAEEYLGRHRPLVGGVQIAPWTKQWYGTLGGRVIRKTLKSRKGIIELIGVPDWMRLKLKGEFEEDTLYGVTNRHVVMWDYLDDARKVESFVQPFNSSGKVLFLERVGRKGLDCALLRSNVGFDNNVVEIGKVNGVGVLRRGDQVQKHGARTGYSKGTFLRSGISIQVDMGGGELFMFHDLLKFTKFSEKGDSGSFILNMSNEVVSLLNSGSSSYTFGIPIKSVLKELQVEVKTSG